MNGHIDQIHAIVEPISLSLDLKRALPPLHTDLGYDISGRLHIVKVGSWRVMFNNTIINLNIFF